MNENIYLQVYVFLYTLYGGIIIGILYDFVDVLINDNLIKRRSISDLLFWAFAFSIIVGLLFYVNNINFRFYNLLGFGLGWFIYFFTLSKLVRRVFHLIKEIIRLIGRKIICFFKIITFPIRKIAQKSKAVNNLWRKIINKVVKDFKKYKSYLFKS
ncbi:spore cortex biosynthesis protein YabQ [Alkalibaculum bacchi]|jgi:spore cortex biosynthesis protein YabQ|uniref:Spore cortex biosynthesis protein YabQ n=1 Tax=Alkalibaculum bacchi TaxID=645887 RepID=A0A366IAY2_9FIRM|nr:spore cortex biosynthesis protein YabQ [Alkalibaculum bacchi]RBP67475.1 spore cortex biosynthesis protein YabQ [Alkalibaculum bacchi]